MATKKGVTFSCPVCGKSCYRAQSKKTIFCGRDCAKKHRSQVCAEHGKKLTKTCRECGKEFKSYRCKDIGFCCATCYHAWRKHPANDWRRTGRKRVIHTRECPVCKKTFTTKRIHQRYCSRGCFTGSEYLAGKKQSRNGRWAINYSECVRCGRTSSRHSTRGMCINCAKLLDLRKERGTFGKLCVVCGEERTIDRAHILPRAKYKDFEDQLWNHLHLCAKHHRCFDVNELYESEFTKIKDQIDAAFSKAETVNDKIRYVMKEFLGK